MYAVSATVTRTKDGWTATRSLGTFYLDETVQGIVSEDHAERIARDIIDPFHACDTVSVCAVKLH